MRHAIAAILLVCACADEASLTLPFQDTTSTGESTTSSSTTASTTGEDESMTTMVSTSEVSTSGGTSTTSPTTTGEDLPRDRLVFLSRMYSPGTFGIDGADAICNQEAQEARLPWKKSFHAWISDGVTSPSSRFNKDGRFVLSSGTVIAESWDDLTDGTIQHPIDETLFEGIKGDAVWTATKIDGTSHPSGHCEQ